MKRKYIQWGVGLGLAGAAVVLLDALFLEKYFFEVKHFNIGNNKSAKKIKILLLTDLHFRKRLHAYQKRMAAKINEIDPHLILVAGDTIDQTGEATPAKQFLALLKHSIPKLAIFGNHDHASGVSSETLQQVYEQHNGHLLDNETRQLNINGATITITGLDDFIKGESCFADAIKNVGNEEHHLMLVHSPLQQELVLRQLQLINARRPPVNKLNIQYIFAGHNHGGQVRFGSYVPVLPKGAGNYIDGWYNDRKPYLYVSKGFGTSGIPFRFGARSEIVLLHYGV
ncbi:MAG: metallophosphoesterase [Segetibacter sp.]|nr:metallophosphoesterase [Segetibacter sp.]